MKVILRINEEEGRLLSGPEQQEIVYRTVQVSIDDEHGTGILELGYQNLGGTIKRIIRHCYINVMICHLNYY